MEVSTVAIFT